MCDVLSKFIYFFVFEFSFSSREEKKEIGDPLNRKRGKYQEREKIAWKKLILANVRLFLQLSIYFSVSEFNISSADQKTETDPLNRKRGKYQETEKDILGNVDIRECSTL